MSPELAAALKEYVDAQATHSAAYTRLQKAIDVLKSLVTVDDYEMRVFIVGTRSVIASRRPLIGLGIVTPPIQFDVVDAETARIDYEASEL